MAYEIISQNNNTTTLSDGTNTITVPSRVVLATGTTYEITEVNNSTATLEGSDGSVIRDVPCVAVLAGGGGGDSHNKGYYATQAALEEAYPTGEDGDYAIVGATDTVWVWDSGTSAWKDTDTKGQVTSVNNQTGDVTIGASDVLPTQTGNSGKFLTTDGTNASWGNALANKATNSQSLTIIGTGNTEQRAINIGYSSSVSSSDSLVIGYDAHATCSDSIAIGKGSYAWATLGYGKNCAIGNATVAGVNNGSVSFCTALGAWAEARGYGSVQIGNGTNNDAGTFKVALTTSGNSATNYELLSSNGTIPTDRLTKANTTVTLAVADWSSSTQTVSVTGVTATSIVLVAPDSASQSDYTSAGILCTAQGAGTLTFTCSTTPTNAITVNVVAL